MSKDKKTDKQIFAAKIEQARTYLLCRGVMPEIVSVLTSNLSAFGVSVVTSREMTGFVGEVVLLGYAPEDIEWFATNRPGMTVTCLSGGTVMALSELYARYGREIPALFARVPLIVAEIQGDGDGDTGSSSSH